MGGWIESVGAGRTPKGLLSADGKKRARPYALLARDIYRPDGTDRGDAALVSNWIEILQTIREKTLGVSRGALQTLLGRAFGFNAALYRTSAAGAPWVLSFQGSEPLGLPASGPQFVKMVQDWLLTNAPATLDVINKVGEPAIPGLFDIFLNPRKAPSTQYDVADIVTQQVVRAKGRESVVLTGHSLGGGLAQYAAIRNNVRAIVFNSAGIGFHSCNTVDAARYSTSICHLVTTPNASAFQRLNQIVVGRAMQAGAILTGVTNPGLAPAMTPMLRTGAALAGQPAPPLTALGDQLLNEVVTTLTNPLSRHFGALYVIGVGGHGMGDVLACLAA